MFGAAPDVEAAATAVGVGRIAALRVGTTGATARFGAFGPNHSQRSRTPRERNAATRRRFSTRQGTGSKPPGRNG
jgi:hypothetical protein